MGPQDVTSFLKDGPSQTGNLGPLLINAWRWPCLSLNGKTIWHYIAQEYTWDPQPISILAVGLSISLLILRWSPTPPLISVAFLFFIFPPFFFVKLFYSVCTIIQYETATWILLCYFIPVMDFARVFICEQNTIQIKTNQTSNIYSLLLLSLFIYFFADVNLEIYGSEYILCWSFAVNIKLN